MASACDVDESNEKLGYKIRHWKTQKVPYILVVGKQEAADGTVNVNERGIEEKRTISSDAFARRTARSIEAKDKHVKFDIRVAFAALALALGSCQGLDSGGMGGGGMMGPPVSQPGPMGTGGDMQGPTIGANGQAELTQPGATLAPNQTQFAVADGPSGVKCPVVTLFGCTVSFNIPTPAPAASGATPTPKPTPTPTPTPSPSASDDSDDNSDSGDTTLRQHRPARLPCRWSRCRKTFRR